jgi:hypothetical protein
MVEQPRNINANDDEPEEPRRYPKREQDYCTHCKKTGHTFQQCRTRPYDEDTLKVWDKKRTREAQPKLTFNRAFNPTNAGRQPFVRPHGGTNGNEVQNSNPPPQRRMPYREARKYAIPPGGRDKYNYYKGERTAFNINYSRGVGAPGTQSLPFRNPAPWQYPRRDNNHQAMERNYEQYQPPRPPPNVNRQFQAPRPNFQNINRFPPPNRQGGYTPRTMGFGPNTAPIMQPNRYGTMQRSPPRPFGQNRANQINMIQEIQDEIDQEDEYYYINANHYTQDQKN